jgi:1-acyl-sn-glycerol-3-phosphate acyltransferase
MIIISFFGTVLYYAFIIVLFGFSTPIALVIWFFSFPFDKNKRLPHKLNCLIGKIILFTNPFWRSKVHGRDKIDKNETYVIASNHLSLIDIPMLIQLYPLQFKYVAKKELTYIPFIGWVMATAKYILLDRKDPKSQIKMMRTAENYLKNGVSIGIFPEGTRSKSGELGRFKDGASLLAKKCNKKILPICMYGNNRAMPKKGFIWKGISKMDMYILDPIDPSGFEKPKDLSDAVRDAINDKLSTLV